MTKVLQGNMNGAILADQLLDQWIADEAPDILLLSEPYRQRDDPAWIANADGRAVLYVVSGRPISSQGSGRDCAWARVDNTTYVSVYLSPNLPRDGLRAALAGLEDWLLTVPGDIVMGGDFNARAMEWGEPRTRWRGGAVLEMIARLGLQVANQGSVSTYRRPGFGESIPDVTFTSERVSGAIRDWRVSEEFTGSDHQYILFEIGNRIDTIPTRRSVRWNAKKLDRERLVAALHAAAATLPTSAATREEVESLVDETMALIARACDAAMPRKNVNRKRRPAYWWTEDIAELRRESLRTRRRAQRARNRRNATILNTEHRGTKKRLCRAIRQSKLRCWEQLCREVDMDPWGLGYKIVTRRLGSVKPTQLLDARTTERVVDELFPVHEPRETRTFDIPANAIPPFTEEELTAAVTKLKSGRAPGPSGTPAEVLQVIARTHPGVLLNMFNACLSEGVFSKRWKKARLTLIDKKKGIMAFRPLCILDNEGKLMEALLRPRIRDAIRDTGDLSDRQYGSRPGRSTIGAIREVTMVVETVKRVAHVARPVVLLVTLDVKNAFNSARWVDILGALESLGMPPYLLRMAEDYFRDRTIQYETSDGPRSRTLSGGIAQGAVLGPDFWGVLVDGLLRMAMPDGVTLVGYVDDTAAVIVATSITIAKIKTEDMMRRVGAWMEEHGLRLAHAKTEIVILSGRRDIPTVQPIPIGPGTVVESKPSAVYLGVTIDRKLTFAEHIRKASEKASSKVAQLSRLMANTRGPRPAVRRLLMSTTHSILLYGAEVWAEAMSIEKYRKTMAAVQRRGALRIASSYRTVSEAAVLVISNVVPIDLLAFERKHIYDRAGELGRKLATAEARANTLEAWQQRWARTTNGRWTHRLIPSIEEWSNREHGEVNFYLSQFLTGHGYFRKYLFGLKRVRNPLCKGCENAEDTAEHTFFECLRWTDLREQTEMTTGTLTPENVVPKMLQNGAGWGAVATFVERVLRLKREEGHLTD